jgi:hypothetical protein
VVKSKAGTCCGGVEQQWARVCSCHSNLDFQVCFDMLIHMEKIKKAIAEISLQAYLTIETRIHTRIM